MHGRSNYMSCDGCKGIRSFPCAQVLISFLLAYGSCAELHPDSLEEASVVLGIDGLSGHFVVSGRSELSEQMAFKDHLIALLKADSQSLSRLEHKDVTAFTLDPDGYIRPAIFKRHVLEETEATFVPEHVRIDFAINFDHMRGISRKAIQESLHRIADVDSGGRASEKWRRMNETRKLSIPATCSQSLQEARCETTCAEYFTYVCNSCVCDENLQGTPQCICILSRAIVFNAMFSNTIYAVAMLLVGLCARRSVYKHGPLTKGNWPNVSPIDSPSKQHSHGVFECCANMNTTMFVCCCPAIRLAMNYYYAGAVKGYTKILIVACVIYGCPAQINAFILPILLFWGRVYIRKVAWLDRDYFADLCCVCCCQLCVICQEAQHIDASMAYLEKEKLGESGDLVGQAIKLEADGP